MSKAIHGFKVAKLKYFHILSFYQYVMIELLFGLYLIGIGGISAATIYKIGEWMEL
jgi:hypothetical protein